MKNSMICITIIFLILCLSLSAHAREADLSRNWGVGFQGNYPLLGGISIRYYGLSPVYLQIVGRFIMNGSERDNMLGGGVSYAVFEHKRTSGGGTRLYLSLEGGERYEKNEEYVWDEGSMQSRLRILTKKTYGVGIAFGVELTLPILGTQIGFNAEIGQGYGQVEEDSQNKNTASFILGGGIHVYF